MSGQEQLEKLLRGMGDAPVPEEDAGASAARRRRVVHHLEGSLRGVANARAKSDRTRRIAIGFAAAAVVLLGFGAMQWARARGTAIAVTTPGARVREISGDVTIVKEGGEKRAATGGDALAANDGVTTAKDARARITLESSVSIEAGSATALLVDPVTGGDEAIDLQRGRVLVQVPKLGPDASFRVKTRDAEVIVHGTTFIVEVCDRCGGAFGDTKVEVREGVVAVRHGGEETRVAANEQWPAPTAPPTAIDTANANTNGVGNGGAANAGTNAGTNGVANGGSASNDVDPSGARVTPNTGGSARVNGGARTAESTLAEQNRLYQSALEARRRGDDARAVSILNDLLARFPQSPLTQEARIERLRCLDRLGDHGGAAAEARKYLVDYPEGFGRDEAKKRALPQATATPTTTPSTPKP